MIISLLLIASLLLQKAESRDSKTIRTSSETEKSSFSLNVISIPTSRDSMTSRTSGAIEKSLPYLSPFRHRLQPIKKAKPRLVGTDFLTLRLLQPTYNLALIERRFLHQKSASQRRKENPCCS